MTAPAACPVCKLRAAKLSPVAAMAYGFAIGCVLGGVGPLLDVLCPNHEYEYVAEMEPAALALGVPAAALRGGAQ